MSTILGLDIGVASIGWAIVENEKNEIIGIGSRIIPMGAELSKFEQGQAQTKNANRRIARGIRKLNKRYKQRRNKLIYILQQADMLPAQIQMSEPFDNPLKIDKISILPISKKQKQYSALDLLELRVKALKEKISLQELGKIIYLFNQLRGYSGGGSEPEQEEETNEIVESEDKKVNESYTAFAKILEVSPPEIITYKGKKIKKVSVKAETENGELIGDSFLEILKPGESLELQVTTRNSKQRQTITFKLPNKTSWRKKMENLENQISELSKQEGREVYISEFFLDILKYNRWTKIRQNVILRSRYQAEFDAIWDKQYEINPEFKSIVDDKQLLNRCITFVFPDRPENKPETAESKGSKKEQFRTASRENGFKHLVRNQIIYYQRELKDQTNLISNCRYELGEKAVAKSHPVFQEYKIWEQINKLTINTKTENGLNKKGEKKYTYRDRPIDAKLKEWMYNELQEKKEISFGIVFNKLKKDFGLRDGIDFLNGLNPKAKLRGNETKLMLKRALGNLSWSNLNLDDLATQIDLWDILYNAKGNEYDLKSERTALILNFLRKQNYSSDDIEKLAIQISKIKFSRSYGAQSLKAINKILPLVRAGSFFDYRFTDELHEKIVRLLNEQVDGPFEKSVQEYLENNQAEVLTSGGLMNAYATILVYNRHTAKEYSKEEQFKSYGQIQRLEPGELRNPLVEQLISETLMIVREIWKQFGKKPDEIRIELARELKSNADRREKVYKSNRANQKANDEVKKRLFDLQQEITIANIEKYKLWNAQENLNEDYLLQWRDPSKSEIEKMRLWEEQGHVSPYTGNPIRLSELYKRELYDVDHIIPRSRYFDDSFGNKVICEKGINSDKNNRTAMEYFEIGSSTQPNLFSKELYIEHVNKYFNGVKRKNLLATQVPADPVARQIKETQYISLRVKEELAKVVGNEVKTTTGGVTDYLRNQWGLTDKFKKLLLPRYEKALPKIIEEAYANYENDYTAKKKEYEGLGIAFEAVKQNEEEFGKSFSKSFARYKNNKLIIKDWSKRIDHRHHAIDALVIACTEPAHVKRLNDLNKELQTWIDRKRKQLLPDFEGSPTELLEEILNLNEAHRDLIFKQIERFRKIDEPWKGFPEAAQQAVEQIIVSQKPKDRLLIQENEKDKNDKKLQIKIRGQLHEGTLYGKSCGVEAYRIPLTKLAGKNFATEKTIDKVVNTPLKEALRNHLQLFYNKKEEAFSAEGIVTLNKALANKVNKNGRPAPHTPISSVKVFYRDPSKIKRKKNNDEPEEALQRLERAKAYNQSLYVKTGDNYLFAVMEKDGQRCFDIITLFDATNLIEENLRQKGNANPLDKNIVFKEYFEEKNKAKLLFTLKQGDPIYLPEQSEEIVLDGHNVLYEVFWKDKVNRSKNIHYVTKYSGDEIYFIHHTVADTIVKKKEFGTQDAYQNLAGQSIKKHCIKINIDRLGNIKPV